MDAIKQQLDELMGKDRNVPLNERNKRKEHYDDPDVCKFALVSICPHDLFPNTKCDLGVCTKRHDEHFKKMFLQDENRFAHERRYINETIRLIESILTGADVKIKKAQQKLDANVIEVELPTEIKEKLDAIDNEIKALLHEVERLGEDGQLEESEEIANQAEMLKKKKRRN